MKAVNLLMSVLLLFPAPLQAGEVAVSLKEAISIALQRNNLIKATDYRKAAAEHGVNSSRGRWLPRIYLEEAFAVSNAPTRVFMMKLDQGRFTDNDFLINNLNHPSSATDFRTAFSLEQPIFDLGIPYGVELARKDAEQSGLVRDRHAEEVGFRVMASYLDVQKGEEMLAAAEQAVRDAAEHRRLARVRSEAGMGLKSDELRSEAFLAEMEERRITAENDLLLARMRLALATGGEPGESLRIADRQSGLALDPDVGELTAGALKRRKDLLELEKAVEKAGVGVKLAGSAFLPTLYAGASYQMNDRDIPFGRDNDAWIAGVNLRWQLFDGMSRCAELARSRALESSARESLEQQAKEVALQVRESLLRRKEAEQRLAVARASLLNAEEGVRLIGKRYANSLATLVEVLDAQTALNRARASVVENETGLSLATARVWFSAGIFLQEVMK